MFTLYFWQCFPPDLCSKSAFQLHGRADKMHVCRSGWETRFPWNWSVKEKDSHGVKNPLMTRNQPARQAVRSAWFSFLPVHPSAQQPTWKSAEEIWLPGLRQPAASTRGRGGQCCPPVTLNGAGSSPGDLQRECWWIQTLVRKPVWEEMIFFCLAGHMSNFVSFRLHLWLRSGTCRSEKPGLWFMVVTDRLHEALRKREDRALCKTKYSCWAVKSTGRPHSQVYFLKLLVTSFWKNTRYEMERGHIDSMGWNMVQRSLI